MSGLSLYLQELFLPVIRLIGRDVHNLQNKSAALAVNGATRLIQTQRIIAEQVAKERGR